MIRVEWHRSCHSNEMTQLLIGDVVYAQTWEVLTLKNPIGQPQILEKKISPPFQIPALHVTSRRPCWWSRTRALLSSGNKTLFSCKFFQNKFYCIDPQHDRPITWLQTKNSSTREFPTLWYKTLSLRKPCRSKYPLIDREWPPGFSCTEKNNCTWESEL